MNACLRVTADSTLSFLGWLVVAHCSTVIDVHHEHQPFSLLWPSLQVITAGDTIQYNFFHVLLALFIVLQLHGASAIGLQCLPSVCDFLAKSNPWRCSLLTSTKFHCQMLHSWVWRFFVTVIWHTLLAFLSRTSACGSSVMYSNRVSSKTVTIATKLEFDGFTGGTI